MIPDKDERQTIHDLLLENQRLLTENNQLLHKIQKRAMWSLVLKVAWFLIIIGAPFLVYYYFVEPYFSSLGSSFEVFRLVIQEVPGWKQFYEATQGGSIGGE
jgi:hypothetical protein